MTYDNGPAIVITPPTTIKETAREFLASAIRGGGIQWRRQNDPDWRDKPWHDGVLVDLDNSDVVETIIDELMARLERA